MGLLACCFSKSPGAGEIATILTTQNLAVAIKAWFPRSSPVSGIGRRKAILLVIVKFDDSDH